MMRRWPIALVAALATISFAGCANGAGEATQERDVLVAHFRSPCAGVGPMECLMVRTTTDEEWQLHHTPIEGFEHEPGFEYRLRIREEAVEDPPADASSIRWVLVDVLEKTPAAGPGPEEIRRAWRLEAFGPAAELPAEASEVSAALATLPRDSPVTLEIGGGARATGSSGCNRYTTDFDIENGHEIAWGGMILTRMACEEPRMTLESEFLRNLEAVTRGFVRDGRLELHGDSGVLLVFVPWEAE
jgi:heat shock protein HslJ